MVGILGPYIQRMMWIMLRIEIIATYRHSSRYWRRVGKGCVRRVRSICHPTRRTLKRWIIRWSSGYMKLIDLRRDSSRRPMHCRIRSCRRLGRSKRRQGSWRMMLLPVRTLTIHTDNTRASNLYNQLPTFLAESISRVRRYLMSRESATSVRFPPAPPPATTSGIDRNRRESAAAAAAARRRRRARERKGEMISDLGATPRKEPRFPTRIEP